jgi:hypothetical protein
LAGKLDDPNDGPVTVFDRLCVFSLEMREDAESSELISHIWQPRGLVVSGRLRASHQSRGDRVAGGIGGLVSIDLVLTLAAIARRRC